MGMKQINISPFTLWRDEQGQWRLCGLIVDPQGKLQIIEA